MTAGAEGGAENALGTALGSAWRRTADPRRISSMNVLNPALSLATRPIASKNYLFPSRKLACPSPRPDQPEPGPGRFTARPRKNAQNQP